VTHRTVQCGRCGSWLLNPTGHKYLTTSICANPSLIALTLQRCLHQGLALSSSRPVDSTWQHYTRYTALQDVHIMLSSRWNMLKHVEIRSRRAGWFPTWWLSTSRGRKMFVCFAPSVGLPVCQGWGRVFISSMDSMDLRKTIVNPCFQCSHVQPMFVGKSIWQYDRCCFPKKCCIHTRTVPWTSWTVTLCTLIFERLLVTFSESQLSASNEKKYKNS